MKHRVTDLFAQQQTINQYSTNMSPKWLENHFITSVPHLCPHQPLKFSNDIWHVRLAKLKINNELVMSES